jgi:toxin-antitoxin system PIN domain toxin
MRALLDVNVLIALLDTNHLHHTRAMRWLETHIDQGWSSCPITQNGCIRILSQTAYPNAQPAAEVALRLAEAAAGPTHEFWADEVSLLDPDCLDWRHVLGARQVTDVYLLALAVRRGGRLVTLDGGIPLKAVAGAKPEHLLVLD